MEAEEKSVKRISKKKTNRICIISIIIILSSIFIGLIWKINLDLNSGYSQVDLEIALIHSNEGFNEELYNKLNLDDGIDIETIKEKDVKANTLSKYDIIIVSNVDLSSSTVNYLNQYVKTSSDNTLIMLIDDNTKGEDLANLNITIDTDLDTFKEDDNDLGYGICRETGKVDELTENIPWNTMPEIKSYTQLTKSDFYKEDAKETKEILKDTSSDDSDDLFLFYKDLKNGGEILVFTIWFDDELNINEITRSFPYLGYFFYCCYMFLEEEYIPEYHEWPSSPIPHFIDLILISLVIGGMAIGSFLAFMYMRNYSEKNPLTGIESMETEEERKAKEKAMQKINELREEKDQEDINTLESIRESEEKFSFKEIEEGLPEHLKGWEAVGLHRQIGGFWTVFFLLLVLILPLAAFFLWFFPTFIFSSPSGMGYYSFVGAFFGALWVFADFGTSYWVVRRFAGYRVSEPEKAIAAAQLFIWFQVLTGAFQILFVGFFGALIFPHTPWWAHLTYVFVWYSIFQWLGFFAIYTSILHAFQRSDVANVAQAATVPLFIVIQSLIVPLFIFWGANNPRLGLALGAAVGASIANFTSGISMFFITWYIFRKTFGYSGLSIFRVDFDGKMVKDLYGFGWRVAIGHTLVPLVMMLEVILLSMYLDNYSNWLGYIALAGIVLQVYQVINFFAGSMTPALAEAKENEKEALLYYNITSMMKWVNHFTYWMTAALLAIAPVLIFAITPPEFQAVSVLIPLLLLFYLISPLSWMGDNVFMGCNHPNLARNAWILEQSIRAILLIILIPLLAVNPTIGIAAIYFAYNPALFAKDIYVWYLIKKKVAPGLKIYPFKTIIAPGIAGIVFYFITLIVIAAFGFGLLGAIVAAAFALILGPFLFFFLSGLFGGWSQNGLEEFNRSISIMRLGGFVGRGLYKCCRSGAMLSPWKEKGTIAIYAKARIEAWELTLEKKKIEKI